MAFTHSLPKPEPLSLLRISSHLTLSSRDLSSRTQIEVAKFSFSNAHLSRNTLGNAGLTCSVTVREHDSLPLCAFVEQAAIGI
jgi:hypothetical protein